MNLKKQLVERYFQGVYALACDNEANDHFGLRPSRWFRAKIFCKAFFFGI